MVSFLVDMYDYNASAVKSEKHRREAYQSLTRKSIERKFHSWQKFKLCKVVHNAGLH